MTTENNVIHGLFLLFEGLPKTIVESQVLSHANDIADIGIKMDVLTFAVTKSAYVGAMESLPALRVKYARVNIMVYRGFRPALPFSEILNGLLLLYILKKINIYPDFVRARTEYSTSVAAFVKRYVTFRLIWDARGDAISEFLGLPTYKHWIYGWAKKLKVNAIKRRLAIAKKQCDFALFVSEELQKCQAGDKLDKRKAVVPCVAANSKFYFCEELRLEARDKLEIMQDEVVLMYSGSLAHWQCIPETVALIVNALRSEKNVRAIVLSPDFQTFGKLFPECLHHRILCASAKFDEVNFYLNASDIGIMLRHENKINWVASPVKFSEYSLSGLLVVMGDAVEQASDYASRIGNKISTPDLANIIADPAAAFTSRGERALAAKQLYDNCFKEVDWGRVYSKAG